MAISLTSASSECPAGAAERTPEGAGIGGGRVGTPGSRMGMAVNPAGAGAATRRSRNGVLASLTIVGPLLVAAIASDGRPGRHRRWQGRGEILEVTVTMDRLAAEHGQDRRDVLNGVLRHGKVVVRQHRQVGELTLLDLALLA